MPDAEHTLEVDNFMRYINLLPYLLTYTAEESSFIGQVQRII